MPTILFSILSIMSGNSRRSKRAFSKSVKTHFRKQGWRATEDRKAFENNFGVVSTGEMESYFCGHAHTHIRGHTYTRGAYNDMKRTIWYLSMKAIMFENIDNTHMLQMEVPGVALHCRNKLSAWFGRPHVL